MLQKQKGGGQEDTTGEGRGSRERRDVGEDRGGEDQCAETS